MTAESLKVGGLELLTPLDLPVDGARFEVLSDDATWGNPQPIEVAIRSLLVDGSVTYTQGYDNRVVNIRVTIEAPNGNVLAEGEDQLFSQLGRRNELEWTPPDGWGPVCVFDVVTSRLEHVLEDFDEAMYTRRTYAVTLTCLPFARPQTKSTVAAFKTTDEAFIYQLVDTCDTTIGWTASSPTGTPEVSNTGSLLNVTMPGAALSASDPGRQWAQRLSAIRTGIIVMADTPYLTVVSRREIVQTGKPDSHGVVTESRFTAVEGFANSVNMVKVRESRIVTGNQLILTTTFLQPDSIAELVMSDYYTNPRSGPLQMLNIDRSNQVPTDDTYYQGQRMFNVGGSARTEGSVAIFHPTQGLGIVLAYFAKDNNNGYNPQLRRRQVSGNAITTQAGRVSGGFSEISGTAFTADIPIRDLPAAGYSLMGLFAKVGSTTTRVLTWTAQARFGGVAVGELLTGTVNITGGIGVWGLHDIAHITLPTVRVPDPGLTDGVIRVTLLSDLALSFDEGLLYDLEHGQLVGVNCGTGTPAPGSVANRVWIDPPSIDTPLPGLYVGTAANRSDASYPASLIAWKQPVLHPGVTLMHLVTTGAQDATAELEYYKRFFTHVHGNA